MKRTREPYFRIRVLQEHSVTAPSIARELWMLREGTQLRLARAHRPDAEHEEIHCLYPVRIRVPSGGTPA